mgnify:CR=1 FL=1
MAFYSNNSASHTHRAGHVMGDLNKKTSIGDGKRKKGSYKRGAARKAYRGQGRS